MNNQQQQCTYCGDSLNVIDRHESSQTLRCLTCGRCFLHRAYANVLIRLETFRRMQGSSNGRRSLDDRRMAERLVDALRRDCWPSRATIVDFGIDSAAHLGALQHAVGNGVTAYDLDRVLGDGPATTKLVRSVPKQPYTAVKFQTVWDELLPHGGAYIES